MKYLYGPDRVAPRPSVGVLRVWGAGFALLLAACSAGGPAEQPTAERPSAAAGGARSGPTVEGCGGCSVVLISIDTLRADRLGTYGNPRQPSPNLDALAAGGVLFERAYSVAYHTAESHMAMMTSLFPSVHMVRNAAAGGGRSLDPGVGTLAEVLRDHGYDTAGFHGGGNVGKVYGFDRGFDVYRRADDVSAAIEWLDRRAARRSAKPFFLFFHTYHTHDPYTPSSEWTEAFDPGYDGPILSDRKALLAASGDGSFERLRDEFWSRVDGDDPREVEHLLALYDGEIAEIDRQLAALFERLESMAEPPLILLVSDHGEEFGEHGKFIHDQLYNELLHVPFVLHGPGVPAGVRVTPRVSLVNLAPTLLDLVGLEPPEQYQGRSLLPMVEGGAPPSAIYAEKVQANPTRRMASGRGVSSFGFIADDRKLIVSGRPEVYDLTRDPDEKAPLDDRGVMRRLAIGAREIAARNDLHRQALGIPLEAEVEALDEETRQELKALGYIQ